MMRQLLAVVLVCLVSITAFALDDFRAEGSPAPSAVVRDIDSVLARYSARANFLLPISVPCDFTQIFQERIVFDDVKNSFPPGFINKFEVIC